MAKTNVSKGDLRLLKRVHTKTNDYYAKKRADSVAKKVCYYCNKAWVEGRKVCIGCSTKQSSRTALWGFRKIMKQFGIDNPTDALETLALAKGQDKVAIDSALMNAIEASEYKRDVG